MSSSIEMYLDRILGYVVGVNSGSKGQITRNDLDMQCTGICNVGLGLHAFLVVQPTSWSFATTYITCIMRSTSYSNNREYYDYIFYL